MGIILQQIIIAVPNVIMTRMGDNIPGHEENLLHSRYRIMEKADETAQDIF